MHSVYSDNASYPVSVHMTPHNKNVVIKSAFLKTDVPLSHSISGVPKQFSLSKNLSAWETLNPPHFVTQSVMGHRISFKARPSMETRALGPTEKAIQEAVSDMLEKGAIEPASHNAGFYSCLFTVPKKGGSRRPVINLKPLNSYIFTPTFRMASVCTVAKLIQEGDWATSIDLKDAFFHVPIHRRHPLSFHEPSLTLTTDASMTGWGASLGRKTLQGTWPASWNRERRRHINELKMRAVLIAVKSWCRFMAGQSVQLLADNSSTVLYFKKEGETKSAILSRLTQEIWIPVPGTA